MYIYNDSLATRLAITVFSLPKSRATAVLNGSLSLVLTRCYFDKNRLSKLCLGTLVRFIGTL